MGITSELTDDQLAIIRRGVAGAHVGDLARYTVHLLVARIDSLQDIVDADVAHSKAMEALSGAAISISTAANPGRDELARLVQAQEAARLVVVGTSATHARLLAEYRAMVGA